MEQVLPGVSIEVRPEGLIIPGQISIGTIGMVGTASRGPVGTPQIVGSLAEARQVYGAADAFAAGGGELTLVRALELAYAHGAQDVIAVRVANGAAAAAFLVASASGDCCSLTAATPGAWANELEIGIGAAGENAVVEGETHAGGAAVALAHTTIVESVRNRIEVLAEGSTVPTLLGVVYAPTVPAAGQVQIAPATGVLTFAAGEDPGATDTVIATYVVAAANAVTITLRYEAVEESFTVVSGAHLVNRLARASSLARGTAAANAGELPTAFVPAGSFLSFGSGGNASGTNGVAGASYGGGLEALLNEPAHIVVAAGQSHATIGATLTGHVAQASSDANKRERIGVVGSAAGESLNDILNHALNSDRVVFVAPGVAHVDTASNTPVVLPGGYAAAAVAGLLSGFPVNRSLTNKRLAVGGLETLYTQAQLRRLVLERVLALEAKLGFRVVKGITTSTNTAWHQITTRRIVDKAKFGVRSAANPYIGLLNNERVRAALRSTVNSFLSEMVLAEELVSYELEVTATRDDERRGIARVTMVLRPTFSIDFIKVTMFLE